MTSQEIAGGRYRHQRGRPARFEPLGEESVVKVQGLGGSQ